MSAGYLLVEPEGASSAHLHMLHAHMTHSDKPLMGSTAGRDGARATLDMIRILYGGELGDRAVVLGLINSLSPLGYSTEMLDALIEYARARQPVVIAALAMAGSTGPVTLAGVLAMQSAELLAGIVAHPDDQPRHAGDLRVDFHQHRHEIGRPVHRQP